MPRSTTSRRRDAYVALVTAGATVVLVVGLLQLPGGDPLGPHPAAFATLAALLFLGEMRPLQWYSRTSGLDLTVTWSFAAALALVGPFSMALAVLAISSAAGDLVTRKPFSRVCFNAGQLTLSLSAGIAVLELFDARFELVGNGSVSPWWPVLAVVAGIAVLAANGALVSFVIALDQGTDVGPLLRTSVVGNLATDGLLLAMAPAYVIVAERSLPMLPLLLGSAIAVHSTAQLAVRRQREADYDQLTGLATRRVLQARLEEVVASAAAGGPPGAVMIIDLDGFKQLNDRLGHAVGDIVLRAAARRLEGVCRPSDVVARLGGDEFAVIAHPLDDASEVSVLARRLADALAEPLDVDGYPVAIGASVGAVVAPDQGADASVLLERADIAMYEAKRRRLRSAVFASGAGSSPGRVALLRELPQALENGDLQLRFQPIVRIGTDEVESVEALIRWRHPRYGLVEPLEFIPMAEQTELVRDLTAMVVEEALRSAETWRAAGHDLVVAINGSARNLEDLSFPDLVADRIARAGSTPDRLEIELTENAMLRHPDRAAVVLRALAELGVRVAVDDFGTGFSSLVHLRDLPVNRLKIDRSFIGELPSSRGVAIVGPLCDMAHNLGLETVAEGVERASTMQVLSALGCDHAQGYAITAPLRPAELGQWLDSRAADAGRRAALSPIPAALPVVAS